MASVVFKKREGVLELVNKTLSWTPKAPPGSKPEVTIPVANITNLQQTPPDNPKVKLKVFAQSWGSVEPITYLFAFSSATKARAEADSLRNGLSKAILATKNGGPAMPSINADASSAAVAITKALASRPDVEASYGDEALRSNIELQQSLLKSNSSLSKTFMEALKTKPDTITTSQFTTQFWSSRLNLLRAHAIEKYQSKGAYNVLSTIKSRTEDNVAKLNITREQINLIFSQHDLVKRVYDENVPRLSEEAFWSRFFQSRLLKKLKGERITDADPQDAILDKYLSVDEDAGLRDRLQSTHVPHIIDIAGNEENHSQRKGNAPDLLMRPTSVDRVPIIRAMNSQSQKLLSKVTPNDVDPSEPIGMDEDTFDALALRDLQGDSGENRIILNVKDQSRFFSSGKEHGAGPDDLAYTEQDPRKVLKIVKADLEEAFKTDLSTALGVNDDSDSASDDEPHESTHMGSKAALRAASAQIFAAIAEQREQNDDLSTAQLSSTGEPAGRVPSSSGLSQTIFDRLVLTHATTTEFLSHFWAAFLSGDAARADEIKRLVETLERAMERIRAVTDDAEAERAREIELRKRSIREHYERTHRKLAFDPRTVKGGRVAVDQLMGPTVKAVQHASAKYAAALAEQEGSMRE